MAKLDSLIQDFSLANLSSYFRSAISSFKFEDEEFDFLFSDATFEKYESIQQIGIATVEYDELIFIAAKTTDPLTERSGKKNQYEIAKKS